MGKRHGGLISMLLCFGALACWWSPADSAWHPDGSSKAGITLPPLSAPPPTAGADLPHFGFPLQPTLGFAAPPVSGEEGYPFIGSNPTVPLPTTGTTDTATVLPMPGTPSTKVVGYAAASVRVHITITALALFFSLLFLLS